LSLALSTLIYEWRRYLAAVIALAVAAVLVLSMTGMFMGVSKSFTATVDRSPGEVMILAPQAESLFSNNSGQPRRIIPKIYGNASVTEVQALNFNFAFWSNFPKEGQVPSRCRKILVMTSCRRCRSPIQWWLINQV
jgi:putative ABC transport system permease protein